MKEPAKSKTKKPAPPKKGYRESAGSETVAHSYISGATFGLKKVTYAVFEEMAVFEGDIILGSAKEMEDIRNSIENPDPNLEMAVILTGPAQVRWPDGIMPFTVDPALPNQQRVTDAINHIHANTNLRLVARTNQADFVNFVNGSFCASPVGREGGQQNIILGSGCDWPRAVHEICHSAGLWHEQSREDRDSFVTIHFDNIPQSKKHNFDQHISDGDDFGPYDYDSLMHYGRRDFASDTTKDTVTPKPDPNRAIGQRTGLSLGDISAINFLYPRKAILGDTSSNGPALARRDGKLLLGWTGTGNLRLNFMSSTDGLNFADKVTLGDLSPNGLALTVFNGLYFVAWTGVGNNQLNVMRSANGVNWDNKVTLADTSLSSPALAVLGNRLCIAWRGVGNNRLNLMQSGDGISWQNKVTLSDTTTSGPALATLGSRLLIGWRGVGNNRLNVMRSANGASFSGKVTLGETTVSRPQLLVRGNRAFLSWQGVGNRFLNILSSADGAAWVNKFTSRETCIDGPALSELGNSLVWGWTGTNAAHNLNTTLFNWA